MNWLNKIVSTTFIVVTGCIIAIVLTLFYMFATLLGTELNAITFGSMLSFSAAFSGVGYKQFKSKRETAWAEDEDGVAYRPGTRVIREDRQHDHQRYNPGFNLPKGDFSDVTSFPANKEIKNHDPAPVESVEEYENGGDIPDPIPTKKVEEEEKWEGDD